jgi:two-component system sensor histidine kinase KdpD
MATRLPRGRRIYGQFTACLWSNDAYEAAMENQQAQSGPALPELASELIRATALVATAALLAAAAERWQHFDQPALLFATAVVYVSVRARRLASEYAALLSFVAYNYGFISPRYTLDVSAPGDVATLVIFLLAALACSSLGARLQAQVRLLRAANARAGALQAFGRRLTVAVDEREVVAAAADALHATVGAELAVLAEDEPGQGLRERGAVPREDAALAAAVERCWSHATVADTAVPPVADESAWHCILLGSRGRPLGVAALRFPTSIPELVPEAWPLVEAMLRDLGQAFARLRLARQLEAARMQGESDRMRAALLSSVSHDLRSPLSTIIGSAESLALYDERLSRDDRLGLARDIATEGRRLDRYIQNLLDMARVGPGAPAFAREWIGLDELGGALLARARRAFPGIDLRLDLPDPAPLLHVHPALVEQALFNLVDNAVKFGPPGGCVQVAAHSDGATVDIDVSDGGPGIPPEERARVFERFYAADRGDRGGGTGLGLTIAHAIATAHGGELAAVDPSGGVGATIRLRLPVAVPPDAAGADE